MNDAQRFQKLLASKGRPMWQRHVLRVVCPAWRAKERRVAEFMRLAATAHEAQIKDGAELLRQVEEDGVPYDEVKDEIWDAWSRLPKDANPPTKDQVALAYRTIRMYLAVCPPKSADLPDAEQ
jgi:hypothetical protein